MSVLLYPVVRKEKWAGNALSLIQLPCPEYTHLILMMAHAGVKRWRRTKS
jgi:hypothetical protein